MSDNKLSELAAIVAAATAGDKKTYGEEVLSQVADELLRRVTQQESRRFSEAKPSVNFPKT